MGRKPFFISKRVSDGRFLVLLLDFCLFNPLYIPERFCSLFRNMQLGGLMAYDSENIFAKILRGEIPCKKVYEDDFALAFHDINAKAPVHVLVIPKGPYTTFEDFVSSADPQEMIGFDRAIAEVIRATGVAASGYRLISNAGLHGGQEVPHYHVHVLGGGEVGPMVCHR